MAFGLALHTMIDGIALAANVAAESEHVVGGVLLGVGTFLAIALHKAAGRVNDHCIDEKGGWSRAATQLVNGSFARRARWERLPFWLGIHETSGDKDLVIGAALVFSAGVFLCILPQDLSRNCNSIAMTG